MSYFSPFKLIIVVFNGFLMIRRPPRSTHCISSAASDVYKRQVLDSEEKTAGGIIIPDTAKEKPQEGEVVAVGPGAKNESGKVSAMDVKVGDIVLFGKWSGTEVKIDGKEYSIMKESDIMGISKGKK